MKKSLIALAVATVAVSANAAKTLPTEPYVVDGYTPDTRTSEAKETYSNRVTRSDVEGNNHSVFGQDNTVSALHGSSSVYGNQNVVGADAKDGNIFGDGSSITGYQAQAYGDNNHLKGEQNTGFGMNNVVNGDLSHAIGGGNNITGDQATAVGHYNLIKGHNSVAIGYDNKALANETTVIGERATASGLNAGAFGSMATATGESALALGTGSNATADSAVAIGNDSNATGKSSVALGESTNATGVFATALGDSSNALANGSVAISVDSQAKGINSMALGRSSLATHDNSVALGSQSVSKLEKQVTTATVGENTYSGFAGTNPIATVSVGDKNKERQIVNVAAGEISATSTDAINGSQLYAVAKSITGAVKLPIVEAGDNTTVNISTNANGQTVYTVSSKDFTPEIKANSDKIAENAKEIKTNAGLIKDNSKAISDNKAKIAEVEKEAKRHSIVKAGKNTTVTKTTSTNGESIYTVDANIDHLATKAEVKGEIGKVNQRINGVEGKVAQNAKRITQLDRDIRKNRKRADAGTAAVAAMANIPQVYLSGKSGVGVGVGYKHGQSALAVGYSRASDNGRHIIKASIGLDSQKDATIGAGYMYQW